MKMESLRRAYGIAEPVRRGMELKIVRDSTFRPAVLGGMKGGSIHEDILTLGGRDSEVQWEDIFPGTYLDRPPFCPEDARDIICLGHLLTICFVGDEFREPPTFHDEMEKRLKMDF